MQYNKIDSRIYWREYSADSRKIKKNLSEKKKSDISRPDPFIVYADRIKISCNACNEYYGRSVFSK